MAEDYMPTTDEVRQWFSGAQDEYLVRDLDEAEAAFGRWLAEHDRAVAATAWDEGERHESEYLMTWGQFCPHGSKCNPYRAVVRSGEQGQTDG